MLCVLIYAKLFANYCIIPTLRAENFMFNGKLNYVPGIQAREPSFPDGKCILSHHGA